MQPGDVFLDKYRIDRLIGKGGMGAVYAALDVDLARKVAIKLLLPHISEHPQAVSRFINEGRAAARIEGEHVARVFAAGKSPDGHAYMVLELLEGADLAALLKQRPRLAAAEAVDFVLEALEAVAEAHHHGIVHRDLKPGNLFLARRTNGTEIVKVLDFGISKVSESLGEGSDHALTATRSTMGSPLYMSPEQLRSAKSVDRRSDIWSLGVILYEMLAGVLPFYGESMVDLFVAIREQDPIYLTQHRPDVPPELAAVIHACLARDPEHRIPDAFQLAQALVPFAMRSASSVDRIRGFALSATGGSFGAVSSPPAVSPLAQSGGSFGRSHPSAANMTPPPGAHTVQGWTDGRTGGNTGASTGSPAPRPKSISPLLLVIPIAFVVAGSIFAIYFFARNKPPGAVTAAPPPPAVSLVATAQPSAPPPEPAPPPSASAPEPAPAVEEKPDTNAAAAPPPERKHRSHRPADAASAAPSASAAPKFDPSKDTRF